MYLMLPLHDDAGYEIGSVRVRVQDIAPGVVALLDQSGIAFGAGQVSYRPPHPAQIADFLNQRDSERPEDKPD